MLSHLALTTGVTDSSAVSLDCPISTPPKKSLHEDNERELDLGSQNGAWQQQPLEKEREERGTRKGGRGSGARTACPKPVAQVGHRITQVPGE